VKAQFSVVIPTRSNLSALANCLKRVLANSPADTEVFVITNGPEDDGTSGYLDAVADKDPRVIWASADAPGFSVAANAGLRMADGKFLVVLHDDVLVTTGWLEGMRAALRGANALVPEARFGYVGPRTNRAVGQQNIGSGMPSAHNAALAEAVAAKCREQDGGDFLSTGFLDSFCLMMTRAAYEAVGPFDERFDPAGYEDRDLILRGQRAGHLAAIAPRVFVYHEGGMTTDRFVAREFGALPNRDVFTAKWRTTSTEKLCFLLRTHCEDTTDVGMLISQLHEAKSLGDCAVLLNDRSTLDIVEAIREAGLRDFIAEIRTVPEYEVENEMRDRNTLLEMARATEATWCCWIEPYRFFEDAMTRERMSALLRPVDPTTHTYVAPVRTLWNSVDRLRVDGDWAAGADQILWRNLPWGDLHEWGASKAVPSCLPRENAPFTMQLTLEDFSYSRLWKARERKLPGATDNVLTTTAEVHPTLTHLLMVKNERHEMVRQIADYANWAHEFVVVDTGSTDGTIELCQSLGARVVQYRCCEKADEKDHMLCDFSAARNFAIEQCRTSHILFLDADEGLSPKDFALVPIMLVENRDAYIVDLHNLQRDPATGQQKVFAQIHTRMFRNRSEIRYRYKIHETLEDCFHENKTLTVVKTDILVLHYGYERETPGERAWKLEKYLEHLEEILEKDPNDARALYAYGQHLNSIRKFDEGDSLIGAALAQDKNFFPARFDLALRFARRSLDLLRACPAESVPTDLRRQQMTTMVAALEPFAAA
jgi:glycosyltransferase involved in cell wall biosynthesis